MTQSASEPWTEVHIEHLPQGPRLGEIILKARPDLNDADAQGPQP